MKKIAVLLVCLTVSTAGCVSTAPAIKTHPPENEYSMDAPPEHRAAMDEAAPAPAAKPVHVHVPVTPKPLPKAVSKDAQQNLDEALGSCEVAQEYWQKGELENAVEALDTAYSLLLAIDVESSPELLQAKEDLRYTISKRMLEIYAARYTVATGNHKAIPLDMNKYVEAEIRLLTGQERNFFIAAHQRSGKYRPAIVQALREAGLPEELSWLPLIESGFKVNALSSARALGMWQFIASTGYKFGLTRDRYIDERMDPEKSTLAAIAYFKELHSIFGDWTTCLAAYNCGEGRVLREIKKQNINYLDNFWDLYQRLPSETARYVPRFMATLHIINDPAKYGMDLGEPEPPLSYEKVTIAKQVHLNNVASAINVCKDALKELNPELRYQITPAAAYELKVPAGSGDMVLAGIDRISKYEFPQDAYVLHRIRSGETLNMIARKYGANVNKIMQANGLRSTRIVAGKTLKVPTGKGWTAPSQAPATAAVASTPATHVVRRGDSLWNIARRYGTTVGNIQKANKISGTNLSVGQTLRIPGSQILAQASSKNYVVRRGDTPAKIAQEHGMDLPRFLALNNLGMRSTIYPGQKVLVE